MVMCVFVFVFGWVVHTCTLLSATAPIATTHQHGAHDDGVGKGAARPAVGREGEEGRRGDGPHQDHGHQPERALPGAYC